MRHIRMLGGQPQGPLVASAADLWGAVAVSPAGPRRPLRSDARVNRLRLVASAAALFASDGVDVSLEAIARRAGVGIGTLYRHFPTRDTLVEEVYRQEVDRLCAAADEFLLTHPPDVALEAWMQRFVAYTAGKRGMADALQSVMASNTDCTPPPAPA